MSVQWSLSKKIDDDNMMIDQYLDEDQVNYWKKYVEELEKLIINNDKMIETMRPSKFSTYSQYLVHCVTPGDNSFIIFSIYNSFSIESIFDGFPILRSSLGTPKNLSYSLHPAAFPWLADFLAHIPFTSLKTPDQPYLWNLAANESILSETELTNFVGAMITEIIKSIPFLHNHSIEILRESSDGNLQRPNVMVARNHSVPFFVMEINSPGSLSPSNDANLPTLYGQMYDYLFCLKRTYGIKKPYGMISTYEEFRIFWLDDDENKVPDRKFFMSNLFSIRNDHHTLTVERIASALMHGFESQTSNCKPKMELTGFFPVMTPKGMRWSKFDKPLRNLFPERNTKNFFLLRRFQTGADGEAYHVSSASGCQAVVKFLHDNGQRSENNSCLMKEKHHWNHINGIESPRLIQLKEKNALLMPYLEPLSETEKKEFMQSGSNVYHQVIDLINGCTLKGYYQTDASWRHIGWYHYDNGQELCKSLRLLDFGHVEKVDSIGQQAVFNQMMAQLRFELSS